MRVSKVIFGQIYSLKHHFVGFALCSSQQQVFLFISLKPLLKGLESSVSEHVLGQIKLLDCLVHEPDNVAGSIVLDLIILQVYHSSLHDSDAVSDCGGVHGAHDSIWSYDVPVIVLSAFSDLWVRVSLDQSVQSWAHLENIAHGKISGRGRVS